MGINLDQRILLFTFVKSVVTFDYRGYDFGYLMRILLGKNLPTDGDEFAQLMKAFFPSCYDVKVRTH